MVGLGGLEPPTSRLSGVRSNQLSYKPLSRQLIDFVWRRQMSKLLLQRNYITPPS
jgi:hypothetical protein